MKRNGFTLIEILIVLIALILTLAGGAVAWKKKALQIPVTEPPVANSPTPQLSPSPTVSRDKPVYKTSRTTEDDYVRVTISKNTYLKNEEIEITIKNISNEVIFTQGLMCHQAHYFEKKTDQGWEKVGECLMPKNFADEPHNLASGKERDGSLPASHKGGGYVYDLTPGIYRYKFLYSRYGAGGFIIYTPEFKIL